MRYSWHVQPIIEKHCLACHQQGGQGFEASGFSMETYEDFMRGTKYGPMVIPGDSEGSQAAYCRAKKLGHPKGAQLCKK